MPFAPEDLSQILVEELPAKEKACSSESDENRNSSPRIVRQPKRVLLANGAEYVYPYDKGAWRLNFRSTWWLDAFRYCLYWYLGIVWATCLCGTFFGLNVFFVQGPSIRRSGSMHMFPTAVRSAIPTGENCPHDIQVFGYLFGDVAIVFLVMYFVNQVLFMTTHLMLHANFVEVDPRKMNFSVALAFHHHYYDPRAMDISRPWNLRYRLVGLSWVQAVLLAAGLWFVFPSHKRYLMCVTSALYDFWMQNQVAAHEWYHCPRSKRRLCFWWPTFIWFNTMELLGLMSTEEHRIHHSHGLDNGPHVEKWNDWWVPSVFDRAAQQVWDYLLTLHRPGETRMVKAWKPFFYASQIGAVSIGVILLGFVFLPGLDSVRINTFGFEPQDELFEGNGPSQVQCFWYVSLGFGLLVLKLVNIVQDIQEKHSGRPSIVCFLRYLLLPQPV